MRTQITSFRRYLPCLVLAVCGMGCDSSTNRPVYPATGQVTFDGKPAPGAMVVLHPLQPVPGEPERPLGYVDEQGKFSLTTYTTGDGAPAGEYGVSLVWIPQAPETSITGEGPPPPDPTNKLPARYADPKTSGLRVQIKEGPNELAPFAITR